MLEYLLLLLSLLGSAVRDREALVAENLLLRHQLTVLTRPTRKRPQLRVRDKLFWVVVRALRRDWRRHLVLVRPESVIRWHRQAWRLFWRWRSRAPLGRPRLSAEVRELIATMARDNPRWGSERPSHGGLDMAPGDRGNTLGAQASAPAARSRCRLWARLPPAGPTDGHRCHRHTSSEPSCQSLRIKLLLIGGMECEVIGS